MIGLVLRIAFVQNGCQLSQCLYWKKLEKMIKEMTCISNTHCSSHNDSWGTIWELRPSRTHLRLVAPLGIKIPFNTGTSACQCCGYKVLNWVNNPSLRYTLHLNI